MPRHLALTLALLVTLVSASADAADDLNIEAELARPGVRLVAVEFFSKDCEPCKRAAPRWKALHEKYRDRGLRFIVVALDDSGRCPNLGWAPDKEVCDLTGQVSERFGVTGLPAAFLWSWRGTLLVNNGAHVDAVEQAVEQELAALPRVMLAMDVPPALGKQAAGLDALVRAELGKTRKVHVLASDRDQRDLEALRRKTQAADVDERCQLKLGQVLPANAKLTIRLTQGGTGDWLFLEMHDAEKGCDVATGKARWRSAQADLVVAEAVADLLQALRGELQMPGASRSSKPRTITNAPRVQSGGAVADDGPSDDGPRVSGGKQTAAVGRLIVKATPKDAVLHVKGPGGFSADGEGKWERGGLAPGEYTIRANAEHHAEQTRRVKLEVDDDKVEKLELRKLGSLLVSGSPTGAKVTVQGPDGFASTGTFPLTIEDAPPGEYRVTATRKGYESINATVAVQLEQAATARLDLKQPGTLDVSGEPVGARVQVTGPGGFRADEGLPLKVEGAPSGTYEVTVSRDGYRSVTRTVTVRAGAIAAVDVRLEKVTAAAVRAETSEGQQGPRRPVASGSTAAVTQAQVNAAKALGKGVFRDNGDGTVSQTDVGLVWQQADSDADVDWQAAFAYCAGLNLRGGGWRLPGVLELVRLIDMTKPEGERVDGAFRNSSPYFWSASPWVSGGYAWIVAFSSGNSSNDFTSDTNRVRCVR